MLKQSDRLENKQKQNVCSVLVLSVKFEVLSVQCLVLCGQFDECIGRCAMFNKECLSARRQIVAILTKCLNRP